MPTPTSSELAVLIVTVGITITFAWTLGSLVNLLIYRIINTWKNRRQRRRKENSGNTTDDSSAVKRARYKR